MNSLLQHKLHVYLIVVFATLLRLKLPVFVCHTLQLFLLSQIQLTFYSVCIRPGQSQGSYIEVSQPVQFEEALLTYLSTVYISPSLHSDHVCFLRGSEFWDNNSKGE